MMTEERALEILAANVPPELMEHSIRVAETAVELAVRFAPESVGKARVAGLLHDFCRGWSDDALLKTAEKIGLPMSPNARKHPVLIHGSVAVAVLREKFGLDDEDVLAAITHHTVGKAGMSVLEKMIYLSDGAEAGRDYPGVEELRAAMRVSLDEGCLVAARLTLRFLVEKGVPIEVGLIDMHNECLESARGGTA